MREIGQVINIEDGFAKIRLERSTACGDCGACQMGKENMFMEMLAKNTLSAKIGDKVEIETETTDILKASFLMYIVPLMTFVLTTFSGYALADFAGFSNRANEIGFVVGIIFTILSYFIIKTNEKKLINTSKYEPVMCQIIEE